ncbi:hypothetical protein DPMN_087256 [Dreissena polymorpha]|uniref:Uncharacterized protein n=1 Tax=Dreissena polymorpha TaxID=45954 RepID=A0A9D4KS22_DREPO|nr:hypothetical protein DPMN_087256 [Dreissena polymorpha]
MADNRVCVINPYKAVMFLCEGQQRLSNYCICKYLYEPLGLVSGPFTWTTVLPPNHIELTQITLNYVTHKITKRQYIDCLQACLSERSVCKPQMHLKLRNVINAAYSLLVWGSGNDYCDMLTQQKRCSIIQESDIQYSDANLRFLQKFKVAWKMYGARAMHNMTLNMVDGLIRSAKSRKDKCLSPHVHKNISVLKMLLQLLEACIKQLDFKIFVSDCVLVAWMAARSNRSTQMPTHKFKDNLANYCLSAEQEEDMLMPWPFSLSNQSLHLHI